MFTNHPEQTRKRTSCPTLGQMRHHLNGPNSAALEGGPRLRFPEGTEPASGSSRGCRAHPRATREGGSARAEAAEERRAARAPARPPDHLRGGGEELPGQDPLATSRPPINTRNSRPGSRPASRRQRPIPAAVTAGVQNVRDLGGGDVRN